MTGSPLVRLAMRVSLCVPLPLTAVATESPAQGVALRVDTTRIDSVFARFDSTTSPGCALGVIRDGRTLYARGYGMANLETATPITPRTVFDIGSTSKQFTAASIALLVADGRLSLDDDIRKFVPEMPRYDEPITVRQILQHTSGLRDYIGIMYLAGTRFADMTTDAEALDAIVRQKALNFAPGTEHSYSNSGYFLASVIVERVSGMSLADFATQRIFEPLRMTSTLFRNDHALVVPHRATGYAIRDSGGFGIDLSDWEQTGDGAVHTSVEDLARWDRNFYTPTVGGAQMLERLLTRGRLDDGEEISYALGLFVDEYRGARRVHHGGSWAGYRAELVRFPDQRVSVAVLCNLATADPSGLARRVADVLLEEHLEPQPEARPTVAETASAATRDAATADAELARYTGLYFHEPTSGFRRISTDSGRLVLHISGTALPLRPLGGARFQSPDYPITIAFDSATSGKGSRLIEAIEGDTPVTYEPMPPASLGAAALAEYAATYDSEELDAAWTLAVDDSLLTLQHRSLGETRLEPAFADAFTAGPMLIRFQRVEGTLTGFSVSMGRARNIGFQRRTR